MPRPPDRSPQTLNLLEVLLEDAAAWHYGYDLSKRTKLKSGTLYPMLLRLEGRGLLESKWLEPAKEGRPARHAYRLTSDGVQYASSLKTQRPTPVIQPRTV